MLEAIFPNAPEDTFSIGYIHEWTSVENSTRHPDNCSMLFSSGNRCFYGPKEYKTELDQLLPDEKDKGAYGSLLSGSCLDTFKTKVKLLIVEDDLESERCGENGGIMPPNVAISLVGDCHGKISPQLLEKFIVLNDELLSQTVAGEPDEIIRHAVQHRLFFPNCDSNARIAKGTVTAKILEPLFEPNSTNVPDLILPVSSFKGGWNKPIPGLYEVDMWAGAKSISQTTLSSTAEVGLELDSREILKEYALKLNEIAGDPRKIAELFCKTWEEKATARGEISQDGQQQNTQQQNGQQDNTQQQNIQQNIQQENTQQENTQQENTQQQNTQQQNTQQENTQQDNIHHKSTPQENTLNSQLLSENLVYKLLKSDLQGGHYQLLECKYIQKQLERFLQSQRREIATGGAIKWNRSSIIIPSKDLNDDQVCTAVGREGELIMSFRSPLLYEDAIALQNNTFTPDILDPKGRAFIGVSVVSDEPYHKYAARKATEYTAIQGIDISEDMRKKTDLQAGETQQERAARLFSQAWAKREISQLQSKPSKKAHLENKPSKKELQTIQDRQDALQDLLLQSLPLETYSKLAGEDYDGDSKCFAKASDWPYTALHLIEAQTPQNAHPPTIKLPKVSFDVPGQPKKILPEIALFMANKWTELANSAVKCAASVESEVVAVQNTFSAQQKEDYIRNVSNQFKQKLNNNYTAKPEKVIPEQLMSTVREIANIHNSSAHPTMASLISADANQIERDLVDYKLCCEDQLLFHIPPSQVETGLETYRKFLRFQVTPQLLLQNQIAVDSKKSATPADEIAIAQYRNLCHRNPNYLQDKKLPNIYLEGKVIEPNGYSLKEAIIQSLNPLLQASELEARPFYQFRNLFPVSEPGDKYYYTPEQYNTCRERKAAFDSLFNSAVAAKLRLQTEKGPYLTAQTETGKTIEITNVALSKYPERFKNRSSLEVLLVTNENYGGSTSNSHKTCVLAKTKDSEGADKWVKLGTLSESSRKLLDIPVKIEGTKYFRLQNVKAVQALTETDCNLIFKQAAEIADSFQSECSLKGETDAMAAATWHLCCAPELNYDSRKKTQNFVFATWSSQIVDRLNELQFKELTIGELNSADIKINNCIENAEIRIDVAQTENGENYQIHNRKNAEIKTDATTNNERSNSQTHNLKNAEIQTDATTNNERENYPTQGKRTLQIMKDGRYITAGTISENSAQLPIGTTARVKLIPAIAKTAELHVTGLDDRIKVGKVAECEFGGQSSLLNQEYTITIQRLNKPRYLLETSGKVIGELDETSIESLRKLNCLHNNFSFTAELTTYGVSNGTYTVAKSRTGNILCARKQNLLGHYKDFKFQGTIAEVSVNIQQKPEICAAVTTECGLKVLGVFTPNQKESKIALMKAFYNRQQGKSEEMLKKEFDAGKLTGLSFKAYIKFNSTTLTASIDPSSVEYPIQWSKQNVLNNEIVNKTLNNLPLNNQKLINTVNNQALNSPILNSQTLNNTVNNQVLNSETPNSQTLNSPIPNSQTLNSPIPNSQTLNSPIPNSQTLNNAERLAVAQQIIENMNSPPTIFYEVKKPTLVAGKITDQSVLGISVSLRKAETARKFFKDYKIQHSEINRLDASVTEETRRGYAVFHLNPENLPPKIMSSLSKQFGSPIAKDLSPDSPYFQKLRESPPLPNRASLLLQKFYGIQDTENAIATSEPQKMLQQSADNSPLIPAWEKNLIAAAVQAATDNNYSPRTPFIQNTLLVTYCKETETITVIRARDNSTIYSRELGKNAAIINLSEEQKQFLESYKITAKKEIQL
ncbi:MULTISPECIES: hypothetical protein [unclassified Microcoleus]|uniref:hypothetical protein n=1 Tax=unclassified Microcoleus TaxID=2642155 RepID=UPI0025D35163|nr:MULTISPECIES: hypothetical protein [unclassified Microcoleus]